MSEGLSRRQIFGGNLALHIMLEQFLYGNLTKEQIIAIRKQFNQEKHKEPEEFHKLVKSVRESVVDQEHAAENEALDLNDVQNVCQQIELEKVNEQIDSLQPADDIRVEKPDFKIETYEVESEIKRQKSLAVLGDQPAFLLVPDMNQQRVAQGDAALKQQKQKIAAGIEIEKKIFAAKIEPNMEYVEKDVNLTNHEVFHKMAAKETEKEQKTRIRVEDYSKEQLKEQIRFLKNKIETGQGQLNKLIKEQQEYFEEANRLEQILKKK